QEVMVARSREVAAKAREMPAHRALFALNYRGLRLAYVIGEAYPSGPPSLADPSPSMNAQGAVAVPDVTDLDAILNLLADQLTGQRLRDMQTFAREFLRRVSPEDLAARSAAEWVAIATSAFEFTRERRAGQAKLRVFNPNAAENGYESARSIVEIVTDD